MGLAERPLDTWSPVPPRHPAWEAQIARRIADLEAGRSQSTPTKEVTAERRALIEAHKSKARASR